MSAAAQTWTFDLAGQKYIDKDGVEHVIGTNQTMRLDFTDLGTGGIFVGVGGASKVVCTDGFSFTVEADTRFQFLSSVDGAATGLNGQICFVEEGNYRRVFDVKELNLVDADGVGANNITSMVMESVDNRMRTMSWSAINTA